MSPIRRWEGEVSTGYWVLGSQKCSCYTSKAECQQTLQLANLPQCLAVHTTQGVIKIKTNCMCSHVNLIAFFEEIENGGGDGSNQFLMYILYIGGSTAQLWPLIHQFYYPCFMPILTQSTVGMVARVFFIQKWSRLTTTNTMS